MRSTSEWRKLCIVVAISHIMVVAKYGLFEGRINSSTALRAERTGRELINAGSMVRSAVGSLVQANTAPRLRTQLSRTVPAARAQCGASLNSRQVRRRQSRFYIKT